MDKLVELSDDEMMSCEGGAYSVLESIIYGINYGVAYISEKASQANARALSNLEQANANTAYGHYGGARP